MKFTEKKPPRNFEVGVRTKIMLKDCGNLNLNHDEQITFLTEKKAEYDVVRKSWGYYATPSINARLKSFNLRTALVKGVGDKYYVCLVEKEKVAEFEEYVRVESQYLVCWLDDETTLKQIENTFSKNLK